MRQVSFDDGDHTPRTKWKYPREYIDMLREMADTAGIIGQHVNLKQAGTGRWSGICPFHNDSNPSFSVSETGYYCFGCEAKGDIFGFLMAHEGMSFWEAIKHLQQLTGLTPPNKTEALDGIWAIPPAINTDEIDIQDEDTIEQMMWKIANSCRGPLEEWGDIPIVYERIMTIFRVADEALEIEDINALKNIIQKIGNGLLSWERISSEQK